MAQKASRSGASFRRFRFHDLRHLFAVLYLRNRRGTIYDLQMVLGHSSVTTTGALSGSPDAGGKTLGDARGVTKCGTGRAV
nr:hypothetical protein [Sphingosinicella ginsenosidimutans]